MSGGGPRAPRTVRLASAEAWDALLDALAADGDLAVIDLSLSAWRPRHAARELARQLGSALAQVDAPAAPPGGVLTPERQADVVGQGVDAEAAGKVHLRIAWQDAQAIFAARATEPRPLQAAVLAPRFELGWREGDVAFLNLLTAAAPDRVRLTVVEFEASSAATFTLADLLPGLMDKAQLEALVGRSEARRPLAGGLAAPAPAARPDIRTVPRHLFGRLAAAAAGDRWLGAYCDMFGHNLYVDTGRMLEAATLAHAEGAGDLGFAYAARAEACAKTPLERGLALARTQGLRIAAHAFAGAAACKDPPAAAPEPVRAYVVQMRAWGQVMSGAAAVAADVLEPLAAELAARDRPSAYDLYMLNIAALRRLRAGDAAGALQLETHIRQRLASMARPDARLAHVNLLNLSRLARRAGELETARGLVRQAFATAEGVMCGWEAFHLEVLEARAAQSLGEDAGPAWLRAALIWLSEPVPASVPDRVARALLGPDAAPGGALVAEVEAALGHSWGAPEEGPAITVRRASADSRVDEVCDLGFAVVARGGAPPAPARSLSRQVGAALAAAGLRLGPCEAAWIDLGRGRGLERGPDATLGSAIRLGAGMLRTSGATQALDATALDSAWRGARLALNPAIADIRGEGREFLVTFRRRRPPARVSSDLLGAVRDGRAVDGGRLETRSAALALEAGGFLSIEWSCAACTGAGARSLSRAI